MRISNKSFKELIIITSLNTGSGGFVNQKRKRPPATIVPVYPTPNSVKKAN